MQLRFMETVEVMIDDAANVPGYVVMKRRPLATHSRVNIIPKNTESMIIVICKLFCRDYRHQSIPIQLKL